MDRKWRTNRDAINTVLPLHEFAKLAHPWRQSYSLATLTDLYAVYTVLHIEKTEWELTWSEDGQFYYFFAIQTIVNDDAQAEAGAVLEGDKNISEAAALDQCRSGQIQQESGIPTLKIHLDDQSVVDRDHPPLPKIEREVEGPRSILKTLRQIIVPVTSASSELTPRLLQRMFSVREVQAEQLLFALVDSNGVVTRSCLYNYIQAPLEGTGTASLELFGE